MVRPAFIIALVAASVAVAHASGFPRTAGLYGPQGASLPMIESKLDVTVRGPIVETSVTQTFRNDTDRATEATYIFPLPLDAAVSAMAIEVGTRTIHGAVEPRAAAQARYEQAITAGLGAGVLDQERPDVFTQTISAIPPRGSVAVTLRFDTTARYHDGTWELVLPLVVAPRFSPGAATGRPTTGSGRAPDTDRAPDASHVTPGGAPGAGGPTRISLAFQTAVEDVTSPSHELTHTSAHYTLVDPKTDHDAIIRWRAKAPSAGWLEADVDGGFAAVVLEAPPAAARTAAVRYTLVLDRAATTRGDGEAVEHALVRAMFGALGANDRIAVAGSDHLDWRSPEQARTALDETWSHPAGPFDLTNVLATARPGGAALVLISDGLVSDDAAAISAAKHLGVPVHVIGFGPAPNRSLLAAIATTSGGTLRFAVVGDDLGALARDVIADVAAPAGSVSVSWGTLAVRDVVPATLPRLGAGQAALVVARVAHVQAANARARGDVFAFGSVATPKPPVGATTPRGAIGRRWARLELDELVAAGNPRAITDHAMAFGLVSPLTSMVAIGDEVIVEGGVKHTRQVPVSVPEGMRWQVIKRETAAEQSGADGRAPDASPKSEPAQHDEDHKEQKEGLWKDGKKVPIQARPPVVNTPAPAPLVAGATGTSTSSNDTKAKSTVVVTAGPRPAPPPPPVSGDIAIADDSIAANDRAPATKALRSATFEADAPASGRDDDATDREEAIQVLNRRNVRLSIALGSGLVVQDGAALALGTSTLRIETGAHTLLGAEGSLWLVDGLHAQGDVLATVARRLVERLELRIGAGLHLGGGIGPAGSLTLRAPLVRHLGLYLRYDGALVHHDATTDGQSTGTAGVEASF